MTGGGDSRAGQVASDTGASNPSAPPAAGLSAVKAAAVLAASGPNALPEAPQHRLRLFADKLWGPVPWLLESAIVLELVLGNWVQAGIIAVLVTVDALLSFREEGGAQAALALLRKRLLVETRVLRDGHWRELPSTQLVVGDVIHLRQGDLVPADAQLLEGTIELDQSTLTGESRPVSAGPGGAAFSGSVVVRGEASACVNATGQRTRFGRTAELVSSSQAPGRLEQLIMGFVKALLLLDVGLVAVVLVDGALRHLSWTALLPFAVILIVAAVPVALPTTFTLASALGSRELASHGVLVTRLAAIEEAASMEVLCSDKTGTITQNRLALANLHPYGVSEEYLLQVAASASDEATQDPLDLAILTSMKERGLTPLGTRIDSTPFDPATKRADATLQLPSGPLRTLKGAPHVLAGLCGTSVPASLEGDVEKLAGTGARVLGVAAGPPAGPSSLLGLLAFGDPLRPDSAQLVGDLRRLGIRVVMVTGDGAATAQAIAEAAGIGSRVGSAEALREPGARALAPDDLCDVYAEVLPEDKLRLVSLLQETGTVVGMTGDGVNDAPALRKAEVGVAVANATDVAMAAASMVLTSPGLENIVSGVEVSRRIHERMLTYTLNKIVKTLQVSLFLSLGLVLFGTFATTPLLVVLLLLANNFATMSLATDRVRTPASPERWTVRALVLASIGLAFPILLFSFALWYAGKLLLGLDVPALQSLTFVWLVASAQATIYSVRDRRHFWSSLPSAWLGASSVLDLVIVALLASNGWLMAPIGPAALGVGIGAAVLFLILVDVLKTRIFHLAGLLVSRLPTPLQRSEVTA